MAARVLVGERHRPDPVQDAVAGSAVGWSEGLPGTRVLGFAVCAAVGRAEALREAGGFSDLVQVVGEESLLAYDLAARGWDLCYMDSVVCHRHPAGDQPPPTWRRMVALRNRTVIAWMRRPWRVCARETVRLIGAAARRRELRPALGGLLRRLPRALGHRNRLPRHVEAAVRKLESADQGPLR